MSVRNPHRLVTLAFSHYNEKARWALDYCRIDYEERRYLPGFSQLAVLAATRGRGGHADAVSSKLSTPILITRDGDELCDSTEIARWASVQCRDALFPEPAVLELVESLGRELGPYTRLLAYWYGLGSKRALRAVVTANVGRGQALAYRTLAPLMSRLIARSLHVDESHARRAHDRILAQLARVEERLAHGSYLVGERFTAADLTFAALLAPVVLVTRAEGYGATLPAAADLPPEARELASAIRGSRAGAYALDVYHRFRNARA